MSFSVSSETPFMCTARSIYCIVKIIFCNPLSFVSSTVSEYANSLHMAVFLVLTVLLL